ncbi:MAG: Zn-dependent oligopeptidase [Oxalobacter sp.]|nr:Zn-dependent oligopeptidase [Oxalobacter sp.]
MKKQIPAVKSLLCAALMTLGISCAVPAVASPVMPVPAAGDIESQCKSQLDDLKKGVDDLSALPVETLEGADAFLRGWNRLQMGIEDLDGPMSLLGRVSPDAEIRKQADACAIKTQQFITDVYQNEKLYRNMRVVRINDDEERKLRQDVVSAYEDAGISLVPDKRRRVGAIVERLAEIGQLFSKNLRENPNRVTMTAAELDGMPKEYLDRLQKDPKTGAYSLGFSYPEYLPFMQYANNDNAREKYRFAFINRGGKANLDLLQEAVTLRHEMAVLEGYRSYADFALRRRMAKKPVVVDRFLEDVQKIVTETEKVELNDLKAFKAQVRGIPPALSSIHHWDTNYWLTRYKEQRFGVNQNDLRRYFPTQASVDWAMGLAGTLYGLEFKRVGVPAWHDDVQYYEVIDKKGNKVIGGIYLDLFPREGKYGHAAAFPVQGSSTLEGRLPISVLVTNFSRDGLDIGELETLLHEFGHVLHGVMSKTRFVEQSGTSVERDFVEAPSQMFEEWAYNYDALSTLPKYAHGSCPQVTKDLLKRINDSRKFGRGIFYSRQTLYAKYDMAVYDDKVKDVMAVWEKLEGETPMGYDPGTQFPGQFGHIVSGYAAGYYGYMWSKVLALDMLSRFDGHLMNPLIGQFYRKTVLERGSELPADRMVRYFLGRSPDSAAFYEDLSGLERKH